MKGNEAINDKIGGKRVVLFIESLTNNGGAERLVLEEANYLAKNGINVNILTFNLRRTGLFDNKYLVEIKEIGKKYKADHSVIKIFNKIYCLYDLRRNLIQLKPDIIIASTAWDCSDLYLATILTNLKYCSHIHGTIFWFYNDFLKYTILHRRHFNEIRNSVIGHKEFIPLEPPTVKPSMRLIKELNALVIALGVRKSKKIFVLSNQMKWEVEKLYGKNSIVVKGAFPEIIFKYKSNKDIRERLKLKNEKIILNINRLDRRKRIDLLVRAFYKSSQTSNNIILLIGGSGPEQDNIKNLIDELDLAEKVILLGYIKDDELWDYIASCDVFVHPNWADFAIAPYEALALRKKVIWSVEMETESKIKESGYVYETYPTVDDLAENINKALKENANSCNLDLSEYTWESYFRRIMNELKEYF